MLEEEIKTQAEKTCIMIDKKDRACYVAGYLGGHAAAETERQEYEKKLLQSNLDQQNKIVLLSQKVYDLQKAYDKQKEINKDLVDELEQQKAENKELHCCANCRHSYGGEEEPYHDCGYCHAMQCICKLKLEEHTSDIYRMWEDKCERWEMRVN
jgi:hypothetical protein